MRDFPSREFDDCGSDSDSTVEASEFVMRPVVLILGTHGDLRDSMKEKYLVREPKHCKKR